MEITTNTTYLLSAREGYYLTQKGVVEFDNYRTFSKAIALSSEEDANNYEEWSEEQMNNFLGFTPPQTEEQQEMPHNEEAEAEINAYMEEHGIGQNDEGDN